MESLSDGDISRFDPLIDNSNSLPQKYNDEYPIILYEPNIEFPEKKKLKDFIQNKSSIHFFSDPNKALEFAQSLGITSFLFIVPNDHNEVKLVQDKFQRILSDFEKEIFFKDLFNEISEEMIKSFKVFVSFTLIDEIKKDGMRKYEDEVMIICDLKDMAKEFRKELTVIYYDPERNSQNKQKLEEELEIKIEEENIFSDFEELYQRIKNYNGLPYHLIMSRGSEAEKVIPELEKFEDLLGLYIYCSKIQVGKFVHQKAEVQKTLEKLIPRIKEGFRTRSKPTNSFPAFATNFDAWDKSQMNNVHHYLKDLSKVYNRRQAKDDFLKLAYKIYQDKGKELERFENQYDEYNKEEILRWYSKDSPIYKLVNNCLRISSSDSILYCRLILKDIEQAIKHQYQQHSKDFNGVFYRGAYISSEEWEKLERNIGEEIEMYGFLSTTVNPRIGRRFFEGDIKNKIFITIIVPPLPQLDEQGFADISQFSQFKGEQEILFNVRSRFRILEAKISKIDRDMKARHLVLLYGAQLFRKHLTQYQPSIKITIKLPPEVKCDLCGSKDRLFGFQRKENREIQCIDCLIKNSIPQDTPLLALDLEENLEKGKEIVKCFKGRIFPYNQRVSFPYYGYKCSNCQESGKDRYYKWIALNGGETVAQCFECFKKKEKIESNFLFAETNPYVLWQEEQKEGEKVESYFQSDFQSRFSESLEFENQGDIYLRAGRFDLYLEYGKRLARKLIRKRWLEVEKLVNLQKLGLAYKQLGEYKQALKLYKSSLDSWKEIFGEKHHSTYLSITGLGEVYSRLGQYKQALEYFEEAFKIMKATHGEQHPSIIDEYNKIGDAYAGLWQYQQAQEYHGKALDIAKAIYQEKHPQIAFSNQHLASVFYHLKNHQQAIKLWFETLETWKSIFGEKNPLVASIYNTLAFVYNKLRRINTFPPIY